MCFVQRDVLAYVPRQRERYDVIVSNPPYVTESEKQEMERNVLDWEPFSALFVPDNDPLLFTGALQSWARVCWRPAADFILR